MRVILAEKPDMAEKIGLALGIKEKKYGYFILNDQSYLTWGIGHIVELKSPSAYPQYAKWTLESLPVIPNKMELVVSEGKEKQYEVIQQLFNRCHELYIAVDPDREGELIARYLMQKANYNGVYKRVWINDLTSKTIVKAFEEVKDGHLYDNLAFAARLRSYADYYIGMTATRYFTLKAQEHSYVTTLNAGRVLTPTLKLVYDREMDISNHQISYSYQLLSTYKGLPLSSKYFTIEDNKMIFEHTEAYIKNLQPLLRSNKAIIKSINIKQTKISPPLLFDTDSIKTAARKHFKFGIAKTEKLVQALYDKGFISYPRTASHHITENVATELSSYISTFQLEYPEYFKNQLRDIMQDKRYVDNKKAQVHYAIIPTHTKAKQLSQDEQQLYELVVKQTLLAFQQVGQDEVTEVILEHDTQQFFIKNTKEITPGFRALHQEEEQEEKSLVELSHLQEGQQLVIEDYKVKQIKTAPPKRFAEDELIRAMGNIGNKLKIDNLKEKGIGTPATRGATVEKLKEQEFIKVEKNLVYLTQKGLAFIEMVKDHLIADVDLTSQFEDLLAEVEEGKQSFEVVHEKLKRFTHEIIKMDINAERNFSNRKVVAACSCGQGDIIEYNSHYGCSNYQNGCKISISKTFRGVKLTAKHIKTLLSGGQILIDNLVSTSSKTYSVILFFANNTLQSRFPSDEDKQIGHCFICNSPVLEQKVYYGCKKEGCLKVYKTFKNKILTRTQVKAIISGKKTELIKDIQGENKVYNAKLKFDQNKMHVVLDFGK